MLRISKCALEEFMQRITFWHGFILIFSFLIGNTSNANEIKTIPPLDIILEKAHAYSVGKNNSVHKIEYLIKEKLWDPEKDKEAERLGDILKGMRKTKSKLFLQAQIDALKKEINEK